MALYGSEASPFTRLKRSSWAAATILPLTVRAAAESWYCAETPKIASDFDSGSTAKTVRVRGAGVEKVYGSGSRGLNQFRQFSARRRRTASSLGSTERSQRSFTPTQEYT